MEKVMEFIDKSIWGNSVGTWFIAGSILVTTLLLSIITRRILIFHLSEFTKKTTNDYDDLVPDLLQKIRFFFLFIVSSYAASLSVELSPSANKFTQQALIIAFLLQAAVWGNTVITFWLQRTIKLKIKDDAASATTLGALGFIGRLVLWLIVTLLLLDNLGINITALVAGLGVGGIAVALALQSILSDLFASLSIVLDKPFVLGDFIIVDEFMGTVEYIGLKTTQLRSLSGEQIIFSNSDLLKSRVRNYKRMCERRVVFSIGVVYQTSYQKLANISCMIRNSIESQPLTRVDRVNFKDYGDSALNYEAVYYVECPDYNTYMDTQEKINLAIFRKFQQEGIGFAYPTRTMYVRRE